MTLPIARALAPLREKPWEGTQSGGSLLPGTVRSITGVIRASCVYLGLGSPGCGTRPPAVSIVGVLVVHGLWVDLNIHWSRNVQVPQIATV